MITSEQIVDLANRAKEMNAAQGFFALGVQRTFACMLAGYLTAEDKQLGNVLSEILDIPVVSTPLSHPCELNRAAVAGRPVPFLQQGVATQDCIDALLLAVTFPVGLHYAFQWMGL